MKKSKKWLLGSAAVGTALYAGLCGLIHYEIFHRDATIPGKMFEGNKKTIMGDEPKEQDPRDAWMQAQSFEQLTLCSADGHFLKAYYLAPETQSDRWALCAHGYRSRGKSEFRLMTKYYHDHGFHVLLVDHRASGESEGSYIAFGKKESEDLLLWLDWIRTEKNADAKVVLHGVSMGAATVMLLSDREEILPNVKYIVADCGFTGVTDEFTRVLQSAHIPHRALIFGVNTVNRLISGFSLYDVQPREHVKNALVPILFIHGDADTFVPTDMSLENYAACTSEKSLLLVTGAGHARSYPTDTAAYEDMLDQFAEKYLQTPVQS
ncbi:MAG: alpha/beta hydrolase [Clostridia bacterium]|nr:alpha/beta hydrolase [Clostridia bacterium]